VTRPPLRGDGIGGPVRLDRALRACGDGPDTLRDRLAKYGMEGAEAAE
jgi:hypothetical protein